MKHKDSETNRRILAAAARLLETTRSDKVRVTDVAEVAHISVPTIYYHFESRQRLIAEAQAVAYLHLSEPLHGTLAVAERALQERDQAAFWEVVGNHILQAWVSGQRDDEGGVVKVLRDVLSDPMIKEDFDQIINESFTRWVGLIEEARRLGWAEQDIDIAALVSSFWAASVGQTIVGNPYLMGISPERIRDLFLGFVIAKGAV
ncbi:MAG: TetR/AcrR family transcriptional regulator [Lacisediminihabitans sp.]